MIRSLLLVAALLSFGNAAQAQAPGAPATGVYKQVLNNERVRVVEGRFKPGDKTGIQSVPSHVLYMLTEGTLVFSVQGKTPYESTLRAGEALYLPAQTQSVANESDKEVRILIVEMKGAAASPGPTSRGKRKRRR